jgi:hypothetical protein
MEVPSYNRVKEPETRWSPIATGGSYDLTVAVRPKSGLPILKGLEKQPMKISTILEKIDENQLFVPAFQREYVWKRDDVKRLLDSFIKGYPTGTMLTWETNEPPELKGPHQYDERQGAVRILLDGQQRITSLYMLIRGKIPPYYTLPEITNDTRGLYVNVETRELEFTPGTRWRQTRVGGISQISSKNECGPRTSVVNWSNAAMS